MSHWRKIAAIGEIGESIFDIEALEHGYVSCKPFIDIGVDRILLNGTKVQIKTTLGKDGVWRFHLSGMDCSDVGVLVGIGLGIFIVPASLFETLKSAYYHIGKDGNLNSYLEAC